MAKRHVLTMNWTGPDFDLLKSAADRSLSGRSSSDHDLYPAAKADGTPLFSHPKRPAAVLVPIVERPSGLHLFLTKRSSALKYHPGQIAFPGGKVDATDADARSAALREAHEEIGLATAQVDLFGELPAHETVTRFDVYPFLGRVAPDFRPVPEAGEVAEVFEVPMTHVLRTQNFIIHSRVWQGHERRYYAVPYGPYYIWGATARILRQLAEAVEATHAD